MFRKGEGSSFEFLIKSFPPHLYSRLFFLVAIYLGLTRDPSTTCILRFHRDQACIKKSLGDQTSEIPLSQPALMAILYVVLKKKSLIATDSFLPESCTATRG